jgi:DNA-binding MarR family transcriptional regulator
MLRDRRSMTPREIWDGLGVTRQGAIKLLQPLVAAGLVRRLGTRKTGRYVLRT